jgi:hypothetical protein
MRRRPARIATAGTLLLMLSFLGSTGSALAVYADAAPRFRWYLTLDPSHSIVINNGSPPDFPCSLVSHHCTGYDREKREFDVIYLAGHDPWTLLAIPLPNRRSKSLLPRHDAIV